MAEPGLLGYISGDGEKKRKNGGPVPLTVPFTSPSYHVLFGGGDARHAAVLEALIHNAIIAGNAIVAFDTAGMIVPFLVPFLPGDHVKKARGIKERIPPGLVENMKPAGVFFNSPVEETSGSAFKGWFSLPKIVLDAAKLGTGQQEMLMKGFGISKEALMRDVLQSVVTVAFGKDFLKVKDKASAFVDYLLAGFEHLAGKGLPYPTWVHARDALFKEGIPVTKAPSLSDGDIDVFGRTLDYYISNALLFKPPRPGPASMDPGRLDGVNFLLFYLQDMNEREQALALALLFAQHAIATVTRPEKPSDPISAAMQNGRVTLAFDEIGLLFGKEHPVLKPLASTHAMFHEAAMHQASLLVATSAPSTVDLDILDARILGPALAGNVEAHVYVGKVKEKEGVVSLASWLAGKGARVGAASIEGLKPSQLLFVSLKAPGEPVRFDVLESGVTPANVNPSLLKAMLATPILVSKKPATVPPPAATASPAAAASPPVGPAPASASPPVPAIVQPRPVSGTGPITEERVPLPRVAREEPVAAPVPSGQALPLIQALAPKPRVATGPVPFEPPARIEPEKSVAPAPAEWQGTEVPRPPHEEPRDRKDGTPVVEELLDQYEPGDAESDEIGGNKGDVQGDMSSDLDFLSRLLGADQAVAREGKISRIDYNMALNALLFKLENVVKASFGIQFFKELMASKSVPYERAMEMYYQESNAMLKGKFAVQKGNALVYQGIKEALRAIIAELGLQIPMPPDEELDQLEAELVKSLDLPRKELLRRIKDGSLYF
ncbi:MAG: hypothetical protein Q6365_011925 [Candidatus Sigynarchaeota archaeon]